MDQETEEIVRNFIIETFLFGEDNGIKPSDSLIDQGIIDSTGVLELVGFIEENFKIEVDDSELVPDNLDSIERICKFIKQKSSS